MIRVALKIEDIRPVYPPEAIIFGPLVNDGKNINPSRAWVAEIVGTDTRYKFARRFVKPNAVDYKQANSVGSRGVYRFYWLRPGKVYEVSSPISWKSTDRYYCYIVDGKIVKIEEREVFGWLKNYLV